MPARNMQLYKTEIKVKMLSSSLSIVAYAIAAKVMNACRCAILKEYVYAASGGPQIA